ncbi:MAG: fatty acid desaturase [Planctomycetes bacterium]|nr:fatty acid desaturase [Planctomycetota bacterium]
MNLESNDDPRETMASLPRFMQPFLTWLTGMPRLGERALIRWSPWSRLASYLLLLGLGILLSAWAFVSGGAALLLLPLGWLIVSGTQRALYIVIIHNAVHDAFSPRPLVNRLVAEVLSTLLFLNGYDRFKEDHARWHHGKKLATPEDPDGQFLIALGFGPGRSRRESWKLLGRALFSPRFHGAYLKQRFLTNLIEAPLYRRLMSILLLVGLAVLVIGSGCWALFFVTWFLPLAFFYQQSSLIQMMSEHHWLLPDDERGPRGRNLTFGRHLGDPFPARGSSPWSKLRFFLRLFLVHLPARLWVLVGSDLHVHDFHHRHPRGDWANATFARAAELAEDEQAYESRWGSLADHTNVVFDRWEHGRRA